MAQRYIPVTGQEAEKQKKGGNIGLPFGLCEKYGIELPENATPTQAWDALKEKTGLSPDELYETLDAETVSPISSGVNEQKESPSIDELLGEEFKGYKGQAAIDKLLQEKRGFIKDAFERDEIGGISLIWGDKNGGLLHAILKRDRLQEKGKGHISGIEMAKKIPEIIQNGVFNQDEKGRMNIDYKGYRVALKPEYFNHKINWIVSAMEIFQ